MKIRPANREDALALSVLAQKTYIDTFGQSMSQDFLKTVTESRSEDYFKSVLGQDVILVAQDNQALVGFIQFGPVSLKLTDISPSDLELKKIYIDKNFQGHGIGTQLMEAMLGHERSLNAGHIYLDVYDKNIKAIRLYQKYDFAIIGTTPFEANGQVIGYDLLMKKKLV